MSAGCEVRGAGCELRGAGSSLLLHHINWGGVFPSPIHRTLAIRQGLPVPGGLDIQPAKLMWSSTTGLSH